MASAAVRSKAVVLLVFIHCLLLLLVLFCSYLCRFKFAIISLGKRADCLTFVVFWMSSFDYSPWCHGLVCSMWSSHFLDILTDTYYIVIVGSVRRWGKIDICTFHYNDIHNAYMPYSYHEISCLICYFWKSSNIWNCRLLQIEGVAFNIGAILSLREKWTDCVAISFNQYDLWPNINIHKTKTNNHLHKKQKNKLRSILSPLITFRKRKSLLDVLSCVTRTYTIQSKW